MPADASNPLPCPFCGHTDISVGYSKHYTTWAARYSCKRCGIYGPSASAVNRSDAVSYARAVWNSRPPVPEVTPQEIHENTQGLRDAASPHQQL